MNDHQYDSFRFSKETEDRYLRYINQLANQPVIGWSIGIPSNIPSDISVKVKDWKGFDIEIQQIEQSFETKLFMERITGKPDRRLLL